MDLAQLATNSELLSSFVEGVTFEPWKQLSGEASSIAISKVTSNSVLLLKGEHLVRLAYPLNENYKRGGKIRATFALTTKSASAMLKIENALKDRLGSSGMMKKADIKANFESAISAPSQKYPSHTASFDLRIDAPKTALYQMIEKPTETGWDTTPIDFKEISKFSLMSLRVSPTLVWKNTTGKCAIKFLVKQGVVAYEEEIPPPVDEVCLHEGVKLVCDKVLRVYWIHPEDDKLTPKSLVCTPSASRHYLYDAIYY